MSARQRRDERFSIVRAAQRRDECGLAAQRIGTCSQIGSVAADERKCVAAIPLRRL